MARKKKMTVADAADKITKRLGQLDKAPGTTYDKNAVAAEKEILEKKLQQLQAYNEKKRMEEERMAMMNSMYSNPMAANGGFVGDGDPPYPLQAPLHSDSTKSLFNLAAGPYNREDIVNLRGEKSSIMPEDIQRRIAIENQTFPEGTRSDLLYALSQNWYQNADTINELLKRDQRAKTVGVSLGQMSGDDDTFKEFKDALYNRDAYNQKVSSHLKDVYNKYKQEISGPPFMQLKLNPSEIKYLQGKDVMIPHRLKSRAMGGYTKKRYQLGGPPTFDQWKTNNLADWYIKQTDPAQLQQEYNDWLSSNYITPEGGDVAGYSDNLMDRMDYMPTETQTVSVENNPNYGKINPETGKLDLNPSIQTMEGTDFTKVPEKDIYKVDSPQGTEEEREMLENTGLPGSEYHPIEGGQGFDWGEAGYQAARLAPAAYNLIQGLRKPAQEEAYINPYAQDVLASLRNREYNIQPQLRAVERADALNRKNILGASGGNAATYLGNVGASGRQYQAGVSDLYRDKRNIENQWQTEFSEMAATLGYQEALARERQRERELQNLAAKRNFLGTAASQLSQTVQSDRLMKNLASADELRAGTLQGAYFKYNPEIGGYEFIGA